MISDLSYECTCNTVIAVDDWIGPNNFEFKIYFDVNTINPIEQSTCFDRIKVMMESIFDCGFFIKVDNPLVQILKKTSQQKIITLPDEPIDIVMAAIIFRKLSSITEDKLLIRQIEVKSLHGQGINVHFDEEFNENFELEMPEVYKTTKEVPWWERSTPCVSDWFEMQDEKVLFHKHESIWDEDLVWTGTSATPDKKPTWSPTVINGGKEEH